MIDYCFSEKVGGGSPVIVQTPGTHKTLPGVTMHQIQQVMRQMPQAGARVVPRQAIQVNVKKTLKTIIDLIMLLELYHVLMQVQ